jgi:hypothetical protein
MTKATEDNKSSYLSLIEKMEKLDRDMREVKEALLSLKERILNHEEMARLCNANDTTTQGESQGDN